MEIVPGVHTIDGLGIGRAYLYAERDRLTLIDTGLEKSTGPIFRTIQRIGRKPESLQQIVITHSHNDHTGALAEVVERTNAQVLAHAIDAPVVRGERRPGEADRHGFVALLTPILGKAARPAPPARVDRELVDGDEIDLDGRARIVHAPGHTPGSIAIYLPGRRLLFAGDAATRIIGIGPPRGPFGFFNEDQAAARASFRTLAALDFEAAFFGHGRPLNKDASVKFRRAAEKLR